MYMRRHEDEVIEPDEIAPRGPLLEPEDDHPDLPNRRASPPSRSRRRMLGLCGVVILAAPLAFGAYRNVSQHRQTITTAEQLRDFVPNVRVSAVKASDGTVQVQLPATTAAFSTANIFARASGYIEKREVDIGDRVKEGQLLAEIVAPELDHQIAQAQATLSQLQAAQQQAQANLDLAQVTWNRDRPLVAQGWVTQQQGTVDVQNLKAQQAAVLVAEANVRAQQAQIAVLTQQKLYQRVVAPFDGIITQRNIDIGSLVQADAVSSTFMFTIMQSNVIRTQVFVPQDQAFGLAPGVQAVVRVPEIPGRTFPGTVTRIADALQPGTRTLLTEVDIPNPDGVLSPGMYTTIELHIPRKTASLIVPADALIFNSSGLHVAVVEDGVARIRKISVARDFGTEVEARDGVAPGDQVVLNPPVDLADGSKVQVRTAAVARSD
jgi:RND family efflux transporter MFP subunit